MIERTHPELAAVRNRFVEFTKVDVRDGQWTKDKNGYSRIPMRFSLD